MRHTEWLELKNRRRKAPQEVHKPWAVFNYVHGKPYEVCRHVVRGDAENHKRALERFLPNARIIIMFISPEEDEAMTATQEQTNIATPDPTWDYEPIWVTLQKVIFESRHLKKILNDQEVACNVGDTAVLGWLAKIQKYLDEVGQCLGDSSSQLDEG